MTNPMSFEEHLRQVYDALEKLQTSVDRIERVVEALSLRMDLFETVIREFPTQKLQDE